MQGRAFALVNESVGEVTFLNCRPSVIAAAVIYAERRARGIIPFWPSMLAKLTGYQVDALPLPQTTTVPAIPSRLLSTQQGRTLAMRLFLLLF